MPLRSVRGPWFDTRLSYNPALHRIKQAMFHCAVVNDLEANPLPPPHPEVIKYFDPPRKMLKRARDAIDECQAAFKVREGAIPVYHFTIFLLKESQYPRKSRRPRKTGMPTRAMRTTMLSCWIKSVQRSYGLRSRLAKLGKAKRRRLFLRTAATPKSPMRNFSSTKPRIPIPIPRRCQLQSVHYHLTLR